HRNRLWRDFRAELAAWLDGWQPGTDDLLLLGASAGWCLPDGFLDRFARVHAVDLDPLAPLLFRLLHGRRASFERAALFAGADPPLRRHPGRAVLFCNVLGQRRFEQPDEDAVEAELAGLAARLAGHAWASFHDRLSGAATDLARPPEPFTCAGRIEPEALAQRVGATGEWLDH